MFLNNGSGNYRVNLAKPDPETSTLVMEGDNKYVSFNTGTYYILSLDKVGSQITGTLKSNSGTVIASSTETLGSSYRNKELGYGLSFGYSGGCQYSFKNVKIEYL